MASTQPAVPTGSPVTEVETRRAVRRLLAGGVVGSLVEFYEFSVYAVLATTLAAVFFPAVDPTTGLLSTLAVFAVAFFARPLGGFVWGAVGDRIGRKRTLAITVLLMSGATTLMGLLPGYTAIGVAAPVLLVVLRFVQGVSAGGEISGAVSFVAEHAPDGRRGFYVGMISVGSVVGTLLGSLLPGILLLSLSTSDMQSWGCGSPSWRRFRSGSSGSTSAAGSTRRRSSSPCAGNASAPGTRCVRPSAGPLRGACSSPRSASSQSTPRRST